MARHLMVINRALTDIATGTLTRLTIELPPRHGKSELVGRYLPSWYLGMYPERNVMYASYAAGQAAKYGRYARNVLNEFGGLFGVKVADDSSAADRWAIQGREGGMVTAGVGGPLMGKGANVLVIDDPFENAEQATSELMRDKLWEWFESTALSRLEPGGAVIVTHQRWHKDDLIGRIHREHASQNYRQIRLPALAEENDQLGRRPGEALWPERFNEAALESIRDSRSLYWWLAQYQQRPSKHAAVEWPSEYFDGDNLWFETWPEDSTMWLRVVTLDPSKGKNSKTGDYSAYTLAAEDDQGTLWVEADLDRRSPGKMVADGVELCRRFRPHALGVEGNAWQDLLGPMFETALRAAGMWESLPTYSVDNKVNKENRIRRLDPWLRKGKIKFRNTPGTKLLVNQLKEFPLAAFDDGGDSLEMSTRLLEETRAIGSGLRDYRPMQVVGV